MSPSVVPSRTALGREAEARVARAYERAGYAILGRNVRLGALEIDVIAVREGTVVFSEVRRRAADAWVAPTATVDGRKRARLRRAAARYLSEHPELRGLAVRFDVVGVQDGLLELVANAF